MSSSSSSASASQSSSSAAQVSSNNIPPHLICAICQDIAIDPVVPTADKINRLCNHFLCRTCEETKRAHDQMQERAITCPQCIKNYTDSLPDEDMARKVQDFVQNHPGVFDRKTYDDLVAERKESIPLTIQIYKTISENADNLSTIKDRVQKMFSENNTDDKEIKRILFSIIRSQLEKGNLEAAKKLVHLIPQTIGKCLLSEVILFANF